ncbi:hypothetical protein FPV67DRAFT_1042057 [Lyophyllum atratum]|nr:hypothetical protein FPV67DRAFT_1042057 [Lyophyllum atratum]
MTSPFGLPRHSTYTHSPYSLQTPKPARSPIHNPYDKFTQPEFDAWIGGITGALRRALGQDDEVEGQPASNLLEDDTFSTSGDEEVQRLVEEEDDSANEQLDNSLVGYRARRVGKGKARDPRDGPGFGKGDIDEPIVIGTDSEDEEEEGDEDEAHVEQAEQVEEASEEEEEEEEAWDEGDESGEEEEQAWGKGETSAQARTRHEKQQVDVDQEEEEEEEEAEEEYDEEYEEEAERSYQGEEDEHGVEPLEQAPSPVIVLSSDEEQGDAVDSTGPFYELDEEYSEDEGETGTFMLLSQSHPTTISPARHTATEDYDHQPSSPVAEEVDAEEVDEIEEDDEDVQPLDDDTSFPPHAIVPDVPEPVEIPDPWSGPQTYAEDYYSGGDIREKPDELTADHLGAGDEDKAPTKHVGQPEDTDVIDVDVGDIDNKDPEEVQPLSEDTSFPPHDAIPEPVLSDRPVEIPDQWEGPKTFAEDYYAGGDVLPLQGVPSNSQYLGPDDEVIAPTSGTTPPLEYEQVDGPEVVEISGDFEQSMSEVTTFPPHLAPHGARQTEYPVELPDHWDAPAQYAGDYYAGGDVRPGLANDFSADHFGAGDDGDSPIIIDTISDMEYPIPDTEREVLGTHDEAATKLEIAHDGIEDHPGDLHELTDAQGDSIHGEEHIVHIPSIQSDLATLQTPELDFEGLYDDMAIEAFEEPGDLNQPADLSHIDWDYASAFLNGLTASSEDQVADTEVAVGEVDMPDLDDSRQEVTEIIGDPSIDVDGVDGVTGTDSESSTVAPNETEEVIVSVEVANAPAEDRFLDNLSDAPPTSQPQSPTTPSTQFHHHHEFGLPTPPSELNKDINLPGTSEQEDSFTARNETAPEITILEPDELPGAVDIIDADTPIIPEIEEPTNDEEETAVADTELDIDVDAVPGLPAAVVEEEVLTQETFVGADLSFTEEFSGHETFVEVPTSATAEESKDSDSMLQLLNAADADLSTSEEAMQLEETIPAVGDVAATLPSDPELHVSPPPNDIAMPVCADPAVPDPTSLPHTPTSHPSTLSLPGTPSSMLSPAGPPGAGLPTPVSVPISGLAVEALRMEPSQRVDIPNGLFTPEPLVDLDPASPGPATIQIENEGELESESTYLDYAGIDGRIAADSPDPFTSHLAPIQEAQTTPQNVETVEDTTAIVSLSDPTESAPPLTPQAQQPEPFTSPLASIQEAQATPQNVETVEATTAIVSLSDPTESAPPLTPQTQQSEPFTSPLAPIQEAQTTPQIVETVEDTTAIISLSDPTESAPPLTPQTQQPEPVSSTLPQRPSIPPRTPSGLPSFRIVMRKANDPILFSDPYPASLSTPENLQPYLVLDVDNSQDNSISSSSAVDRELEDNTGDALDVSKLDEDIDAMESMELRYPSVQPSSREQVSAETTLEKGDSVLDDLHEADADGDVDPDFVENISKVHERTPPPAPRQADDVHPKTLESSSDSMPVPEAQNPEENGKAEQQLAPQNGSRLAPVVERASDASTKSVTSANSANSDDELPSILIIKKPTVIQHRRKDVEDGSDAFANLDDPSRSPPKLKLSRVPKRKRSSSIATTSPLTRSMSSKQPEKKKPSSRPAAKPRGSDAKKTSNKTIPGKDKGKGKEVRESSGRKGSFDTRSISSRSSSDASSALRMLYPSSQNTSRASSVVSTATSDNSSIPVQPSPTLNKGNSFRHQVPPPPPPPPPNPLFHRHHRAQPAQLARPPPAQKVPSHPTDAPSKNAITNKPSTSSQASTSRASASQVSASQPSTSHRTPVYSSSPVTRSNCRYHKISIPREEDGPRIFFLVPGCSLGDSELIKEEEIVDHGDALPEDGRCMKHDLDAYEFDPYLIGVLRLLVGVDMLREQEVYYLPQPGPDLVPLRRRSKREDKAALSPRRNSAASVISPPTSIAPVSTAGSTSTSASAVRSMYSESELTEEEDSPKTKRSRPSPVEAKSTIGDMGPPDMQPDRSLRAKGSKQGVKRSRTSDVSRETYADTQRQKKQKTGSSDLRMT